ncbi:RodZ family helix-turn-helix domain-containing protein [Stakelama tenebrarum]|uniref:XRE family transcriptional regulator n=1 Tax=Stakelama tenebrarum TaxID=2711215 RepID=A0A6G6Y573_9SPHN|nr:XRE family transcriptional regulator [Sphingosinithalassobacter tenebrarum]QIG80082.1 XRE family transcriptional regulator [Sphingosinithalassobacter tenebrarum]
MSDPNAGTLSEAKPPMTPGTYLRKRREASGLCVLDVAVRIAAPGQTARLVRSLNEIERDELHVTDAILHALRHAFAFDPQIYAQLLDLHVSDAAAAAMLPHPQLCRVCACSWHDPCQTDDGPCHWQERDLCSACVGADPGEPEAAPASGERQAA